MIEASNIAPMVISAMIRQALVKKILVECGSLVNIILKQAYEQTKMEAKDMKPCKTHIHGFNGVAAEVVGFVELPTDLDCSDRTRVRMLPFIVLDVNSPHNALLGLSALVEFRAALVPWCLTLKFTTNRSVGVVHEDRVFGQACYVAELREA